MVTDNFFIYFNHSPVFNDGPKAGFVNFQRGDLICKNVTLYKNGVKYQFIFTNSYPQIMTKVNFM